MGDNGWHGWQAAVVSDAATARSDDVESYRAELQVHCYRILGSVHDAEDAVQDALLRAWRGRSGFDGRSSLRLWLYRVATNAALDVAKRRSRRELPVGHAPATEAGGRPGRPLLESVWVEPFPDAALPVCTGETSPETRYEQREAMELAFVAALQYLAPLPRTVLILREVLGFSTAETADLLDTTTAAVQSALQRARAAAATRIPARSQQATLRAAGDQRLQDLVARYCDALERGDVPAVVELLTEDAAWAMPPLLTWYRGQAAIAAFLSGYGFNERWRHRTTWANGQPAVGGYTFEPDLGRWVPSVLYVLTLSLGGDRIADVTGFVTAELLARWGYRDDRFVGAAAFPGFGLPVELPD